MDDMDGMDWMMAVTAGVGDYFAFWTVQGEGRWGGVNLLWTRFNRIHRLAGFNPLTHTEMFLKMRLFWIVLPLALVSTAQLRGDSVTLKTGEKITGRSVRRRTRRL